MPATKPDHNDTAVESLKAPRIPDALPLLNDDESAHLIPRSAQSSPLRVEIDELWGGADTLDPSEITTVKFYWDEETEPVDVRQTDGGSYGDEILPFTGSIPAIRLSVPGLHQVRYVVDLNSTGNITSRSHPARLNVDKEAPNQDQPGAELAFPQRVIDEGITDDYLAEHDDQVIAIVPRWPDMRLQDKVEGYWDRRPTRAAGPVAQVEVEQRHKDGADIELVFTSEVFRRGGNGKFGAHYRLIDRAGNIGRDSAREDIQVDLSPSPDKLPAPRVPQADKGWIDLEDARSPGGVYMLIDEFEGVEDGDVITPIWNGIKLREFIYDGFTDWPLRAAVDWPTLSAGDAEQAPEKIMADYTWRRGNIPAWLSDSLPVLVDLTVAGPVNPENPDPANPLLKPVTVKGITGDNRITHADEDTAPVRVVVPLYANPLPTHKLELMWADEPDPVATYTVEAGDQENDLAEFFIPWALIEPIGNATVQASYWTYNGVNRQRSPDTDVEVNVALLTITGNRSQVGPHYYSNLSRLVATVRGAGTPYWRYEGQTQEFNGLAFLDTHPELELSVGIERNGKRQEQVLRPVNVTGVYNVNSGHGGCITLNDGSLYGWSDQPALLPPAGLAAVRHVVGGGSAFAALHRDGSVSAWGHADLGGTAPSLAQVKRIVASSGAFVAVHTDGSLSAWGDPEHGGALPDLIALPAPLNGVEQIVGSSDDFCIRRVTGAVLSWGRQWPDGLRVFDAQSATQIVASNHAFAAIKPDRTVLAWGDPEYGGQIPADLSSLLTDVVLLVSTSRAFAALTANGKVHAWGNPGSGGQVPQGLSGMTHVLGSTHAFAAVDAAGQVTVWGEPGEGGTPPSDLEAVFSLSAANASLAAVQQNQKALSWGQIAARPAQADVAGIYAAGNHLVLLTQKSTARAWGISPPGLTHLDGVVSYLR